MIANFLSALLLPPSPAVAAAPEARLALAALLVRLARADGHYGAEEAEWIDLVLAARYGLHADEVRALRSEAEAMEAGSADTVRFTRALKEAVPHEERLGIMEALWQVALADRQRDAAEDALIRLAAGLMGVTDVESALARQRVERKG